MDESVLEYSERLKRIDALFSRDHAPRISLSSAVRERHSEILLKRSEGWTWHEIAEIFREAGFTRANTQSVRMAMQYKPKSTRSQVQPQVSPTRAPAPASPDAPPAAGSASPRMIRIKASRL